MNYFYDVTLNFQEDFEEFYDWEETDDIRVFKKVPVILVNNKTLKDFINNNILIVKSVLEEIKNKSGDSDFPYIAIFASKCGIVALEFKSDGTSIGRSFLEIDDELSIYDILYTLSMRRVEYSILDEVKYPEYLRIDEKMKLIIKTEISSLIRNKDYEKLKYLYTEWFNKEEQDIDKMQNDMESKLNMNITDKEKYIYDLIKLSYSKV